MYNIRIIFVQYVCMYVYNIIMYSMYVYNIIMYSMYVYNIHN